MCHIKSDPWKHKNVKAHFPDIQEKFPSSNGSFQISSPFSFLNLIFPSSPNFPPFHSLQIPPQARDFSRFNDESFFYKQAEKEEKKVDRMSSESNLH